jgi:hypothetical protein
MVRSFSFGGQMDSFYDDSSLLVPDASNPTLSSTEQSEFLMLGDMDVELLKLLNEPTDLAYVYGSEFSQFQSASETNSQESLTINPEIVYMKPADLDEFSFTNSFEQYLNLDLAKDSTKMDIVEVPVSADEGLRLSDFTHPTSVHGNFSSSSSSSSSTIASPTSSYYSSSPINWSLSTFISELSDNEEEEEDKEEESLKEEEETVSDIGKTFVTNNPVNIDIKMNLLPSQEEDEEEEEEGEEQEEIDTDPEYLPFVKHTSKATSASRRAHRRSGPYDRTVPQVPSLVETRKRQRTTLSSSGIKILQEFQNGPKHSETRSEHQQRILNNVSDLIIEHIRTIGSRIRAEADEKSRPGDYLSRMKGCLRNAALGLYLIKQLTPETNLDAELLRDILECVPPPSTRPATKRVDSKLQTVQANLGIAPAERQTVEVYWTSHLLSEDRAFMRRNASKWPGHWERLGL